MATVSIADDFNQAGAKVVADDFNLISSSIALTPGALGGLTALSGPGSTSVTLTWVPPVDNGGSAITSYRVTVALGPTLVQTQVFSGTATTAVITALSTGSTYSFNVSAGNAVGYGPVSSASATPTTITTPPGPVQSLTASVTSDTTVALHWTAPVTGSVPTSYTITSSPATTLQTVAAPASGYVFTGLTADTDYTLTVIGVASGATGSPATTSSVHTFPVIVPVPVVTVLDLPNFYAFPQPSVTTDARVFRPANFGKTITDVPVGE